MMITLKLTPVEGRFEGSFKTAFEDFTQNNPLKKADGRVWFKFLKGNGEPWLLHPSWDPDNPDEPGDLYSDAETIFTQGRFYVVDRAVDLRVSSYWRADSSGTQSLRDLRARSEWSKKQRAELHEVLVTFEVTS